MKKIIPFLVVGIFVLSGLGVVGLPKNINENDIQMMSDGGNASIDYEDDNTPDMYIKTCGEETTELEIEIVPMEWGWGISGPPVVIRNIGNATAYEVEWWINITGGILGRVDKSISGTPPDLPPGENITIKIGLVFGLGEVQIIATARAVNAPEVSDTKNALLLFCFIISI